MEAKQYTISEAAKKLHVGSHVLRFWEEALHLNIPRLFRKRNETIRADY